MGRAPEDGQLSGYGTTGGTDIAMVLIIVTCIFIVINSSIVIIRNQFGLSPLTQTDQGP